jgi:hypothetical protein
MEKYQNIPKDSFFFLSFLRLKTLFACTWKLENPGYSCGRKQKKRLSAHEKMRN